MTDSETNQAYLRILKSIKAKKLKIAGAPDPDEENEEQRIDDFVEPKKDKEYEPDSKPQAVAEAENEEIEESDDEASM